jgi:nicotinamidase-related amidase
MKEKSALVVIDMQNWSINKDTKKLPSRVADFIDKNSNKFDFVLFTSARNTKESNLYKHLGVKEGLSGKQIEMRKEIKRFLTKENLFRKTTYSAFKSKKFLDFLKRNRIEILYLCGINTDKCVLATAFEAFDLGYDIRIIDDLIGSTTRTRAKHQGALKVLKGLVPKDKQYTSSSFSKANY